MSTTQTERKIKRATQTGRKCAQFKLIAERTSAQLKLREHVLNSNREKKEKIPDHLVDSYKHSSANRMAAGSRLGLVMEFFLLSTNFSNTPYLSVTSLS